MAGRVAYYGGIVKDGLVLDLDAAKKDSYPGSGTTWSDISGNQNNGTLTNGPTFNSDNGGSIVFDGVDDRVFINTSINTGQNFTVSVWMYATLLGTTRRALVGNSYNYSTSNGWFFSTSGASTNNTFFFSVGADLAYRVAAANTLSLNQWYYLTAVCQNGGGSINLYSNGNIITTYAASLQTTNTVIYTTAELNIGARISTFLDPYSGNISLVQIYNKALTAQEILQNYNALKGRYGL